MCVCVFVCVFVCVSELVKTLPIAIYTVGNLHTAKLPTHIFNSQLKLQLLQLPSAAQSPTSPATFSRRIDCGFPIPPFLVAVLIFQEVFSAMVSY